MLRPIIFTAVRLAVVCAIPFGSMQALMPSPSLGQEVSSRRALPVDATGRTREALDAVPTYDGAVTSYGHNNDASVVANLAIDEVIVDDATIDLPSVTNLPGTRLGAAEVAPNRGLFPGESFSPAAFLNGLGCVNCPPESMGLTYIVGSVPDELFNVGAGAALGRDIGSTSVLPFSTAPGRQTVLLPVPGDGGPLGATRITDNNGAIPRNRVFVDYSGFNDIRATRTYDSHRATFGLERRFVDPVYGVASSVEFRIPFGFTLNPNAMFGPSSDSTSSEFGNILLGIKTQLWTSQTATTSFGLAFTIPTADDFTVREAGRLPTALIQNNSVHVTPYLATSWTPNSFTFAHIFYSIDVDANGSPVLVDTDLNGFFDSFGRINSPAMQRLDLSFGQWMYRDEASVGTLSGVAWFLEYHYAGSISTPDSLVLANNIRVGNSNNSINMSNGAAGLHFKLGVDKLVTFGYGAPLQDSSAIYKGEFRVLFNKYF